MDVVIDTCAGVHALGMFSEGEDLLSITDRLLGYPCWHMSKKVRTEWASKGLNDRFLFLESKQRVRVHPNDRMKKVVSHQKDLRRRFKKAPGVEDVGLLLLTRKLRCPLITNDGDFYNVATKSGALCFDLFDVCLAAILKNELTEDQVKNELFSYLKKQKPHYHPFGWNSILKRGGSWPKAFSSLVATRRAPEKLARQLGIA